MHSNENEDRFTNVPQEIIIDILTRLPIRAIMICKSVCKSWRGLVESPEFSLLHLSQTSSLAVIQDLKFSKLYPHLGFLDKLMKCYRVQLMVSFFRIIGQRLIYRSYMYLSQWLALHVRHVLHVSTVRMQSDHS